VVTPPVIAPPVVVPPVIVPPVIAPPVVVPPVIVPPVVVPSVVTPPAAPTPVANVLVPLMQAPVVLVAAPLLPQLAVIGGGIRMPTPQLAELEEADRPIDRASSDVGENAFLPVAQPVQRAPSPVLPVYPRKQARH
jgi:hypothetical protein